MTSFFDRQTNCLSEPERQLVWTFLLISLDPFTPGMVQTAYDAAWTNAGGVGGARELEFRSAFALNNVRIDPFDFIVTGVPGWFSEWATSISAGDSDPSAPCVCNSF